MRVRADNDENYYLIILSWTSKFHYGVNVRTSIVTLENSIFSMNRKEREKNLLDCHINSWWFTLYWSEYISKIIIALDWIDNTFFSRVFFFSKSSLQFSSFQCHNLFDSKTNRHRYYYLIYLNVRMMASKLMDWLELNRAIFN